MRALVTGASGFAGRHLVAACEAAGDTVVALGRRGGGGTRAVDLLDADATRAAVEDARPDVVFHLAALAHVGASWEEPERVLRENVAMTQHLLEAVRRAAPAARVVLTSSGEVYGPPASLPVTEDAPLRPQNPYAVSKAAADLLAGFHADAHGLDVVRARAFNHAGPGQEPVYAIASFAQQVARGLERGEDPIVVRTGNPDARRDFTDVRDVVRAYRLLAGPSGELGRGAVVNVCSGRTASTRELVAALGRVAGAEGARVVHEVDPARVRAHEVLEIRGSAERLHRATGWEATIPLDRTLAETVAWWRSTEGFDA